MPEIGTLTAAVELGESVAFIGYADASGTFDPATQRWAELPKPPASDGIRSVASLGGGIAVAYDRANPSRDDGAFGEAGAFAVYLADEAAWRTTTDPPVSNWRAPSLGWTGSELLVWGGEDETRGDPDLVNAGARYDPTTDEWKLVAVDGMPSSPGGTIIWTAPDAVAWGVDPTSAGVYDPTADRWRPVAVPTGTSFGSPAIHAAGRVVSWTGTTAEAALVTSYDPHTDSWTSAPSRCGPTPRRRPVLAWVGDGILVWGGQTSCDGAADVEACADLELGRAFYLHEAALFGNANNDPRDCSCPTPR